MAASKEKMTDFKDFWSTTTGTCSITSLIIRSPDCTSGLYDGTNIMVVAGTEIHGERNIADGYGETVCLVGNDNNEGFFAREKV